MAWSTHGEPRRQGGKLTTSIPISRTHDGTASEQGADVLQQAQLQHIVAVKKHAAGRVDLSHPVQPVQRSRRHAVRLKQRLVHAGHWLPATLTGYLWLKGLHPSLPGWPCPLRTLTGIPCPTCYLTRATCAALHGDLGQSVALHAFGPLAAAVLVGWSVVAIRQRQLVPRQLPAWPLAWGSLALLAYWMLRLWLSFGLGWHGFPAFPER